jgi:predicted PurR-regulated permease PerM
MGIIIGFSLGVGMVGIVMLVVVTFRLMRRLEVVNKELQELPHTISEIYDSMSNQDRELDRRIDDWVKDQSVMIHNLSTEVHLRMDDITRDFQSQLDSRLDKLESKMSSKTVLKG